jgi:hypothetical protein
VVTASILLADATALKLYGDSPLKHAHRLTLGLGAFVAATFALLFFYELIVTRGWTRARRALAIFAIIFSATVIGWFVLALSQQSDFWRSRTLEVVLKQVTLKGGEQIVWPTQNENVSPTYAQCSIKHWYARDLNESYEATLQCYSGIMRHELIVSVVPRRSSRSGAIYRVRDQAY